jgi:hypothetical protein
VRPADREALVSELRLDLNAPGICRACLLFVSEPLLQGDIAEAKVWARRMAPDIWDDGLREHAIGAVRRAKRAGVPWAGAALEELLEKGGRSVFARVIVFRLAVEQADEIRRWEMARLN